MINGDDGDDDDDDDYAGDGDDDDYDGDGDDDAVGVTVGFRLKPAFQSIRLMEMSMHICF